MLNIPTIEVDPLADFKGQVAVTARKYATAHGWCSVVDDALREMGIDPRNPGGNGVTLYARVVINMPVEVVVGITDPTPFVDKTEDEQKEAIARLISARVTFGNVTGVNVLSQNLLPVTVLSLDNHEGDIGGVPPGYLGRFTSGDGRVKHLVGVDEQRRLDRGHGVTALCGQLSYGWTEHSSRDEGRVCERCMARTNGRRTALAVLYA